MEEEELNRGILKQRWSLQRQRKKKKIGGPSRGTDTVKGVTEKRNLVGKSGIQNDELSTRGITKRENEKKKKIGGKSQTKKGIVGRLSICRCIGGAGREKSFKYFVACK